MPRGGIYFDGQRPDAMTTMGSSDDEKQRGKALRDCLAISWLNNVLLETTALCWSMRLRESVGCVAAVALRDDVVPDGPCQKRVVGSAQAVEAYPP